MDGDKPDKEEASRTRESSSDSESERSSTRGRSRGRSRRSPRSTSSPESQPDLHHESTHKSKDQSRGRSRDRRRPGTGSILPKRARSMSRPPSMERIPDFSFEPRFRSLSLDRYGLQSRDGSRIRYRRNSSVPHSPSPSHESTHKSKDQSKDQSRGRSRDRRRPGTGNISPRRARSMSRPPSMERGFSFKPRSRSLDRHGDRSRDGSRIRTRRNRSVPRSPSPRYHYFSEPRRESPGPRCAVCGKDCLRRLDKPGGALHCPQCEQTQQISSSLSGYKRSLEERSERVSEGLEKGTKTLKLLYTVLSNTHDLREDDETQQEENHVHDLFKPSPFYQRSLYHKPVKVVLTRSEAGMGKTVSVQKFTQDWAQGSENQDLDLVLPLSFRELNMARWGRYSLLELIQELHPSLNELTTKELAQRKVLFIFDGLDESRLPLDFSCEVISEVTQRAEVATLLVNLIKGHLLPNALIWITSRPTAANQIPVQYVDRFTKICGFASDQHKEQFFKRRFVDEDQCERVLSFIQRSPTLWGMCQSPLFCWTMATVLEQWLQSEQDEPPSLTELFSHFLLVQLHMKKRKYEYRSDFQLTVAEHELLLKLGRLAFQLLHRGSTHFNQQDLEMQELDPTEALVYSGLCTEVFKQHSLIFNQSPYSFVHPSVQVFLAAVHMMHHSSNKPEEELKKFKLLQDHNTPLLLERFLQELSLKKNHRLLGALLDPTPTDPETKQRVLVCPKEVSSKNIPAWSITTHCLTKMTVLDLGLCS